MPIQDKLPKSRITLVYRTNISGKEAEVDLPFRVLVLGDFSLGSSKDRKRDGKEVDLEDRKLRSVASSNLDALMKDMDMSVEFDVDDKVGGGGDGKMAIKLPITKMKSFHPDEIINHVPKLKALMMLRKLLVEMQADIDNKKPVRQQFHALYSNPEERNKLLTSDQLKTYETLRLPAPAAEATTPAAAPATPPTKPTA